MRSFITDETNETNENTTTNTNRQHNTAFFRHDNLKNDAGFFPVYTLKKNTAPNYKKTLRKRLKQLLCSHTLSSFFTRKKQSQKVNQDQMLLIQYEFIFRLNNSHCVKEQ